MKYIMFLVLSMFAVGTIAGETVTVDVPTNKKLVLVPANVDNCVTVKVVNFMTPSVTFVEVPLECEGYDQLHVSPAPRFPAYCAKYFD